jgi:hypothetical protein
MKICITYGRFQVFSVVVMKSIIFWDMTPCNPLSVNRRFGRTSPPSSGSCLPPACLLVSCWTYFFDSEDGGDMFLRNIDWHSTDYTVSYPRRWYSSRYVWRFERWLCLRLHVRTIGKHASGRPIRWNLARLNAAPRWSILLCNIIAVLSTRFNQCVQ